MGKVGTRRRRQVWVRLNQVGRILMPTGEESDIDTDPSTLGHDLEDDRIGVTQEESELSHPKFNRTVGHVPRKERRRWNDGRCGKLAYITQRPPVPLLESGSGI